MLEIVSAATFSPYRLLAGMEADRVLMVALLPCLLAAAIARNALSRNGLVLVLTLQMLAMPVLAYLFGAFHQSYSWPRVLSYASEFLYFVTLIWVCVSTLYYLAKSKAIETRKPLTSTMLTILHCLLLTCFGVYFLLWSVDAAAWAALYGSLEATIASELSTMIVSFALLGILPAAAGTLIAWNNTVAMRKAILAATFIPWLLAAPVLVRLFV